MFDKEGLKMLGSIVLILVATFGAVTLFALAVAPGCKDLASPATLRGFECPHEDHELVLDGEPELYRCVCEERRR